MGSVDCDPERGASLALKPRECQASLARIWRVQRYRPAVWLREEGDDVPTYQYICTDCGVPLEVVQTFSESALSTCPSCSGRLRKVYSAVGVVFKGTGFYRNDSRDNAKAKKVEVGAESSPSASDSASPASSDTSSDGASKTDKKPAGVDAASKSAPPTSSNGSAAGRTSTSATKKSASSPAAKSSRSR